MSKLEDIREEALSHCTEQERELVSVLDSIVTVYMLAGIDKKVLARAMFSFAAGVVAGAGFTKKQAHEALDRCWALKERVEAAVKADAS